MTYHNGWEIHWSGWREPANQDVKLGFWMGHKGEALKVATTFGLVGDTHSLNLLNMTRQPGWPIITARTPESDAESVKWRALDILRGAIDA